MHIDDVQVLNYIKDTLGIGTIHISKTEAKAYYSVSSRQELNIIIAIFSRYNLNSTKHLDFLAFTQAFLLYNLSKDGEYRSNLKPQISKIMDSMNSQRTDFSMPPAHKVKITSPWLLGFVEGDGSFFVRGAASQGQLVFYISQKGNKALLEAIQEY